MRNAVQRSRPFRTQAPSATYTVGFPKCQRRRSAAANAPTAGRIPRVTRFLALAHRIDGMIRSGELRDWAESAKLVGITTARMTQMANLLLLAPEIQEAVLDPPRVVKGSDPITERQLREIVSEVDWSEQRTKWEALEIAPYPPSGAGAS